ncbi:predicted protein [Naegleria gruberi]|uniref:Predicted protein n=1 Tax=Naegleria gruberi TaxID=5762 RepID=D2VDB7_NAEGR|nr:uncharacterized protein NAEGRDRAFT_48573 [Naegleria gruberi]EFC45204.1 predicted protein [Naegleria gruberi]|eukprot:XP_002677948.1 predicted protein [Naegleria gruberi strain NEG-M]
MPPNRFKRKIIQDESCETEEQEEASINSILPPSAPSHKNSYKLEDCLFNQLIIIKLGEEYFVHRDLIAICLNKRCPPMHSHQIIISESAVRILNETELAAFIKLMSEQVYEKSLLSKRGLHELEGLDEALVSNSLDVKLFRLKYLLEKTWFLDFFNSNSMNEEIDPTMFRAIVDLDFSEIIWKSESDHIYERRRKFVKYTVKTENESSGTTTTSGGNNTTATTSTSTTTIETNTILFPNSSKLLEQIHQCVSMFENSNKETTSTSLDISLENIQNLSLSVSSSKEMELYEKSCIQGFIIQSLKKLKNTCIYREYTPNSDQAEKFKCIAIANIHLSNSSLKLFITSSLEMFFNDDLPNSLFGNLKNFDSLKSVYKDDLMDLISFQKIEK